MISLDTIQRTHDLIKDKIVKTPLIRSNYASKIYLKLENFQKTSSFKERGALANLINLPDTDVSKGVVVASAGNHSQAVAYHAKNLNIKCKVYIPFNTPMNKIANTERHGAEVVLYGDNVSDCIEMAKTNNMKFIHPFDCIQTITGQATIGIEILEQLPDVDCIVVPVGGGGLLAGVISYVKQKNPDIKIISVESDKCPSLSYAMHSNEPCVVNSFPSLADGIAVKKVGILPLSIIKDNVDDHVLVTDEHIAHSLVTIMDNEKIVVEGSGAVAFSAVQHKLSSYFDTCKHIVCICSGGNIDGTILCKIIERGLKADGRLIRICVTLKDKPGNLAEILSIIGKYNINIRNIIHEKTFQNNDTPLGVVKTYIELETIGFTQISTLVDDIKKSNTVLAISV